MHHIFYHHPCNDGSSAAYLVLNYLLSSQYANEDPIEQIKRGERISNIQIQIKDAEGGMHPYLQSNVKLRPSNYNYTFDFSDIEESDVVWILDFSFEAEQITDLTRRAKHVIVIDHHATGIEKMLPAFGPDNLTLVLSEEMCGAALTHRFLFDQDNPDLLASFRHGIDLVNQRDTWTQRDENANRFYHGMICKFNTKKRTPESDMVIWDDVFKDHKEIQEVIAGGVYAEAAVHAIVVSSARNARKSSIGNHPCILVNAPTQIASNLSEYLISQHGDNYVIAVWSVSGHGSDVIQFSLRSRGDINVAQICQQRGGGGHKNAAGFQTSYSTVKAMYDTSYPF